MMIKVLELMAQAINLLQEILKLLFSGFGVISDKQQHFWAIGIIGVSIFIFADVLFHWLAKWSITAISFFFAGAAVIIIVFGLEIIQMVTGSGMVDFGDVMAGIWGFLFFSAIILVFKGILKAIQKAKEETSGQ